ncbi:hypothetical protein HDV01_006696 [Terramyces sp. JEL0728]|nr:hypothetical protein HDV01_006696 [Terramyces sp. JEL0728]
MEFTINSKYRLRLYKQSDASTIAELLANPTTTRYTTIPYPYTLQDAQGFLERIKDRTTILAIVDNDTVVGCVEFDPVDSDSINSAEFGYWLKPELWNQGIMKQALNALLNVIKLYNETAANRIHRVYAHVVVLNEHSGRVLESNGFKKEKIVEKGFVKNGESLDYAVYGRTIE